MTLLLPYFAEATEVHTRILRMSLGAEESHQYWRHVDTRVPVAERAARAEAESWFPGKSNARVRYLIAAMAERYDAFPDGLETLRRWRAIDPAATRIVAHVHLMLSDPLYRGFAGELLVARRGGGGPLDRDVVRSWLEARTPGRWSGDTARQASQKLLAAAHEAGLLTARDPRHHDTPALSDLVLAYVLHLLRGVRYAGTPLDNVYLASLGLAGGTLPTRLGGLGPLGVRLREGVLIFTDPDVVAWGQHTFAPVILG